MNNNINEKLSSDIVSKHVGSLIKLKPEFEIEYIEIHQKVFPAVLERINKSNIRNYSIFLSDSILFSYYDYIGNNYINDMNSIADKATKEWWKITDPMQQPFDSRKEGEWWTAMGELQHFDATQNAHKSVERHAYKAEIKSSKSEKVKNLFSNFNNHFYKLYTAANIQKHNVFIKGNALYVYLEYCGEDFRLDDLNLKKVEQVKDWNEDLNKYLSSDWIEMKEVFHTD